MPISWVLGENLATLRTVSICGVVVAAGVLFASVRRETRSIWWSLMALGLFASAYRVMDAYLDTAHSDSWLLASVLVGGYVLATRRDALGTWLGVGALVAAFWFKQHGGLFAVSGVMFVIARDGWKRAWPAVALLVLLGPVLYIFGGTPLFGPSFHFFTWDVPRRWGQLDLATIKVLVGFFGSCYPFLGLAALLETAAALRDAPRRLDIWHYLFAAAVLSAVMGALDAGCSFNVFIPLGTFCILLGTRGLARWHPRWPLREIALASSFALFMWNPLMTYDPRRGDHAQQRRRQVWRVGSPGWARLRVGSTRLGWGSCRMTTRSIRRRTGSRWRTWCGGQDVRCAISQS